MCKNDYIWNPTTCSCENDEYLGSFINDSVVTCDEIIEPTKHTTANFGDRKATCKKDNLHIFFNFLLFTVLPSIIATIYYDY